MGNKNLSSKTIPLMIVMSEKSMYEYDVSTDLFEVVLRFKSHLGTKTALHQFSHLSCIQNYIRKTEEKNEGLSVIESKIEGTLTNIFNFGERVFGSDTLRLAFIDVFSFELLKNGKACVKIIKNEQDLKKQTKISKRKEKIKKKKIFKKMKKMKKIF